MNVLLPQRSMLLLGNVLRDWAAADRRRAGHAVTGTQPVAEQQAYGSRQLVTA